jgi:hypothetical protein
MASFDAYAWPVGCQTYAIWDSDSAKWRPINHSCNPSAWMDGLSVVARRAVAKGEELTLDYATFEPTHPAFECWCGAAQCRQMIRPNEYREEWFQQRYGRFVSPHIRAQEAQRGAGKGARGIDVNDPHRPPTTSASTDRGPAASLSPFLPALSSLSLSPSPSRCAAFVFLCWIQPRCALYFALYFLLLRSAALSSSHDALCALAVAPLPRAR